METVTSHTPKPPIPQVTKTSCPKLTKTRNLNCRIPLKIYHQIIRGLRCKTNELIGHFHPYLPHIMLHRTSRELGGTATNFYEQLQSSCLFL
jgi:hypothetical protein